MVRLIAPPRQRIGEKEIGAAPACSLRPSRARVWVTEEVNAAVLRLARSLCVVWRRAARFPAGSRGRRGPRCTQEFCKRLYHHGFEFVGGAGVTGALDRIVALFEGD